MDWILLLGICFANGIMMYWLRSELNSNIENIQRENADDRRSILVYFSEAIDELKKLHANPKLPKEKKKK